MSLKLLFELLFRYLEFFFSDSKLMRSSFEFGELAAELFVLFVFGMDGIAQLDLLVHFLGELLL